MSTRAAARPTVGVAMPARDAARYIGAALDSVLGQTFLPVDVVVVDDGSADETARIASSFGPAVRVLSQPPSGPAAARNRGIAALSTDLIALLDADDVWPSDSLEVRLHALEADSAAELCFGRTVQFVSPDLAPEEQRRLRAHSEPQPMWGSSAMLARRSAFERYGLLPEHRRAGDFLEWLLGARAAGASVVVIENVVLRRRLHLTNLTRREPDQNANYLAVVRAELARRRAAGQ